VNEIFVGIIVGAVTVIGTGVVNVLVNGRSNWQHKLDNALDERFKRLEQFMNASSERYRNHDIRITRIESMLQTLTLVMPALRDLFSHQDKMGGIQ